MRSFFKALAVILSTFTLMAFSCSRKKTIGDPYILFEIHGTVYGDCPVADETTPQPDDYVMVSQPLKGVKVSSGNNEAVYTNSNGTFVIYGRSNPGTSVAIVIEDDDGASNGGPFQRMTRNVELRQRDAGDAGNYRGYWFASGVEVKMLLKNESIDPNPTPQL